MSIGQFYGTSFPKLRLGHLITGPFEQIGNFHPEAPTEFGTLLKYTTNKLHYVGLVGTETDLADKFAGIALVEKAGSPHRYPGTKERYEIGEPGNVLKVGSVAVLLSADDAAAVGDVTEGGLVYLGTDGRVSAIAGTDNLIPGLIFTGDVEAHGEQTLVGVRKLY